MAKKKSFDQNEIINLMVKINTKTCTARGGGKRRQQQQHHVLGKLFCGLSVRYGGQHNLPRIINDHGSYILPLQRSAWVVGELYRRYYYTDFAPLSI